MQERTGEAFEADARLTVIGGQLKPGDQAPDFELDYINPADNAIRPVHLADFAGKVRLLNVVNSVDTPVCHVETHRWEESRAGLPAGVVICTVSMDLPYAMSRWQQAEHVSHEMLSSHRDRKFGEDYGVLIKEWRLLQRSVFVIDRNNRIVYAEYVPDQMAEPDYATGLAAAKQAAK
jgi:thioredoxin-dependent peroxiredoxin